MTAVSFASRKRDISGAAKEKTRAETRREKEKEVRTATRMPFRMRSCFFAPKFWAVKMEKALPKSCTGR